MLPSASLLLPAICWSTPCPLCEFAVLRADFFAGEGAVV